MLLRKSNKDVHNPTLVFCNFITKSVKIIRLLTEFPILLEQKVKELLPKQ